MRLILISLLQSLALLHIPALFAVRHCQPSEESPGAYPLSTSVGLRRLEQRRTASLVVALLENAVNLTSLSVLRTSQLLVHSVPPAPIASVSAELSKVARRPQNSSQQTHKSGPCAVSLSLRIISTVDPTPAFCGELASMAPRLRGFDITLYAMQPDDIPAMPECFMAGASTSGPRIMPLAVTRRVSGGIPCVRVHMMDLDWPRCPLADELQPDQQRWQESVEPGQERATWAVAIAHGLSLLLHKPDLVNRDMQCHVLIHGTGRISRPFNGIWSSVTSYSAWNGKRNEISVAQILVWDGIQSRRHSW
ncbi:hypothetical protein POSPLADRAFT_1037646 [Postia placenta MAD-698-R-SB12]|uniref:Protein kinase domain-containing protein n=1 Tax=Postia placenta MAD-698-R-SB12 TaxID=670580 RepID=A0A1X6MIB2_9APHY|nr:hypothetical protein POSPLADRAFT_1037646 [Postia placenta MAD-698-R-SB12]OSX56161.1 hypothetical protein POSPLADRAFT_1037646 [Postia placenta MAD-698-R-SB12]